jgi:hypothetical protein
MEELDYKQKKDLESVLIEVIEDGDDFDTDEFFRDLQKLFEDNHVSISVESEHR